MLDYNYARDLITRYVGRLVCRSRHHWTDIKTELVFFFLLTVKKNTQKPVKNISKLNPTLTCYKLPKK